VFSFAIFVSFVPFVAFVYAQQPVVSLPQQRPPVFRAGAHYVRVDAYPTGKDGRIVEGLTKDDFEIFEDGAPQAIESAEYITFDSWTPEGERWDPRTPEEGYERAADPTYRVFAVVIDRDAFDMVGWNVMHKPLADFLERNLGPHDLFGLLHSKSEWRDLTLGQKTTAIANELAKREWWTTKDDFDEQEWGLIECGLGPLVGAQRADRLYTLLEGIVALFGAIRDERKSIIYVADHMPSQAPPELAKMATGMPSFPKIETPRGQPGARPSGDVVGGNRKRLCNEERLRLTSIRFGERYRELLKAARLANVAFYPISPKGLEGITFTERGGADMSALRRRQAEIDSLRTMADETDGRAIVNVNDMRVGLSRIAADLRAYYVLGYYTSNTKWDGGLRQIKVRLKPRDSASHKAAEVRARRQYRAPTAEEMALIMRPPSRPDLEPASPGPAPVLIGEPIAYRVALKQAPQKVSSFQFDRTERLRVEWPVLRTLDRREVRLLDRAGRPLPVDLPVSEDEAARTIVVELALAPFARGEYAVELTASAGDTTEHRKVAFVMR
jgi:VWFA-related protein